MTLNVSCVSSLSTLTLARRRACDISVAVPCAGRPPRFRLLSSSALVVPHPPVSLPSRCCCWWWRRRHLAHHQDVTAVGLGLPTHMVFAQKRYFQVLQRGYDVPVASLFAKLGLENVTASRRRHKAGEGGIDYQNRSLYCSDRELQEAFLLQASKLKDPEHNPEDRARLEELKDALRKLLDPRFRAQYRSHYNSSNDAQLHIFVDGGAVAATFNPEHQQFFFLDHSKPAADTASFGAAGEEGSGGGGAARMIDPLVVDMSQRRAAAAEASFGGSDNISGGEERTSTLGQAGHPRRGEDGTAVLRLSFEEGWRGVSRVVSLPLRDTVCSDCGGSGKEKGLEKRGGAERRRRRCPQCHGRGSVVFPSATYHLSRPCGYCQGDGVQPPRPCPACRGHGVRPSLDGELPEVRVDIPAYTTAPVSTYRLRGKGHSGRYGGPPGDVVLTLFVAEHRYLHYDAVNHRLHIVLPVPLSVAILGGLIRLPHLFRHSTAPESSVEADSNGNHVNGERKGVGEGSHYHHHHQQQPPPPHQKSKKTHSQYPVKLRIPPGVLNGEQLCVPMNREIIGDDTANGWTTVLDGVPLSRLTKNDDDESMSSSLSSSSSAFDRHGVLVVHVLVITPNGLRLTARQMSALRRFDSLSEAAAEHADEDDSSFHFHHHSGGDDNVRRETEDAPHKEREEAGFAIGKKAGRIGSRQRTRTPMASPEKGEPKVALNSPALMEACAALKEKYRHWLMVPG